MVTAVDRSALDPRLMNDPRVEFVMGDAFAFEPTSNRSDHDVWMVSDIIAFPDRILELLERWCGGHWASHMIVTMKYHGEEPDLDSLDQAIALAQRHGYHCRAKHFFNNKNEVTLMLQEQLQDTNVQQGVAVAATILEPGVLGTSMYPAILPTA
jgi:23S rRNA (cytidine2498-2'-O)-methyltransferase